MRRAVDRHGRAQAVAEGVWLPCEQVDEETTVLCSQPWRRGVDQRTGCGCQFRRRAGRQALSSVAAIALERTMQLVKGVRDRVVRRLGAARRLIALEGHRKPSMRVDTRRHLGGGANHRNADARKVHAGLELIVHTGVVPDANLDDDRARSQPRNHVVALMQTHGSLKTQPEPSSKSKSTSASKATCAACCATSPPTDCSPSGPVTSL